MKRMMFLLIVLCLQYLLHLGVVFAMGRVYHERFTDQHQ